MKKAVILIPMLLCMHAVFSQTVLQDKKIIFGFNLGINGAYLRSGDELPSNALIKNGLGFKMGLLMDYHLNKNISFSPKAELAFNDSRVLFFNADKSRNEDAIFPVSLELMAHMVYKKAEGKLKPYFLVGPAFRFTVPEKDKAQIYVNKPDLAIDIGFGLERVFPKLLFAPEIRYSIGLLNVNQNPGIKSLNFNSFSLMLNFKG